MLEERVPQRLARRVGGDGCFKSCAPMACSLLQIRLGHSAVRREVVQKKIKDTWRMRTHDMNTPHMVQQGFFCLHIEPLPPHFTFFMSLNKLCREMYVYVGCYGCNIFFRPYCVIRFRNHSLIAERCIFFNRITFVHLSHIPVQYLYLDHRRDTVTLSLLQPHHGLKRNY
jgi:hypothetical protein